MHYSYELTLTVEQMCAAIVASSLVSLFWAKVALGVVVSIVVILETSFALWLDEYDRPTAMTITALVGLLVAGVCMAVCADMGSRIAAPELHLQQMLRIVL